MKTTIAVVTLGAAVFMLRHKLVAHKQRITAYLLALAAITITISMVLYPEVAFAAAKDGLDVWWNTVFPALLPFFIGSEILMGLGVVRFMGTLLEPIMRPLFNVPGEGSFVMAMGLASGYPIGAILTAKLRRQQIMNQVEAERLISFANTADPLFMVGAVAVGMFGDVRVGAIIALSHYLAALCVGLTMRFYRQNAPRSANRIERGQNIFVRAFFSLYRARREDGRPFGQILGDAVKQSVNSLLMIGGFIIFFNVLIRIASVVGIATIISAFFANLLNTCGLAANLAPAATSGLFEISIGTKIASEVAAPLGEKIMLCGAIIAWSGLSVHGQVAAVVNDTDIRVLPYMLARLWHAILAAFFTLLVLNHLGGIAPAFHQVFFYAGLELNWGLTALYSLYVGSVTLIASLGLAIATGLTVSIKNMWYRG